MIKPNSYREADLREDVRLHLPEGWKLNVIELTSGSSGKKYWVQVLRDSKRNPKPVVLCDCPEGKFLAPLVILGLMDPCKHGKDVLSYLREIGR